MTGTDGYHLDVLRKRLAADWDSSQTHGYGPNYNHTSDDFLPIHTGHYDDSLSFPQVAITSVGSAGGAHGYKADGTGVVLQHASRADINCWAGSEDDMAASDPDPDVLAHAMGEHVYHLCHATNQWLIDPDNGERVALNVIPLGEPQVFADPNTMADWRALVEVQYTTRHDPPTTA